LTSCITSLQRLHLSHYFFAVRKTIYNFSLDLSRKMKSKKGFVLKQNFSCIKFNHILIAILIVKRSVIQKLCLKNFKVVWFVITISNSTWLCIIRRWGVYNKKLWNIENSFGMLETLFTLKVTVFFMFHLVKDPELRNASTLASFSWGPSQALRVSHLRTQLGGNCRRTKLSLPFETRLLERYKNAIQIYTYIFGQHTCVRTYVYMYIHLT